MTTFITKLDGVGDGPRLAVKDLIDVAGVPTTAGCRAVAAEAEPADADAPCMAGARAAGARIVGKANLHELAFGASGENPWYGTPRNPQDPGLVPGGSSSGSAVAVGSGEADVAYGSDTAGSVRIPSACCGTAGLKTTHGRVPLDGVWKLAESLDTVGPMARDVAGLVLGMAMLEPGFTVAGAPARTVGRLRVPDTDPAIDAAIDAALAAAELEVAEVELPGWAAATSAGLVVTLGEAWRVDRELLRRRPGDIGPDVAARIEMGSSVDEAQLAEARTAADGWRRELAGLFDRVELLALPSLAIPPPALGGEDLRMVECTVAVNLAGVPALALPVPTTGRLPASLQLVGPHGSEELLLATGAVVESAV